VEIVILAAIIPGGYLFFRWISRRRLGDHVMENAGDDQLTSMSDLDAVFASSHEQAKILFLHDPWCPLSARASREVALVDADIVKIDVSRQHELSREIERRTGVRHESPQVILIKDGVAAWDASHVSIDRDSIGQALTVI
jgi:bacillithiol system protein YtxJ